MKSHTRHIIVTSTVLAVLAIGAGVFAWSGLYNIGADDAHTKPVYSMLQMARERSITARARRLHPPPDLNDAARIRQGAGNYNAMCTGCHLAPGMSATELSKGLYPSPPNLSTADIGDPSHHFWVIKHGIKASGMPAWGRSMSDEYIWNMAAFVQQLPRLNAVQYQSLVASSGGHSHGGGETMALGEAPGAEGHHAPSANAADAHAGMDMHDDEAGAKPHAHADLPASPAPDAAMEMVEHQHADGTVESHPATQPKPAESGDGHDHQH